MLFVRFYRLKMYLSPAALFYALICYIRSLHKVSIFWWISEFNCKCHHYLGLLFPNLGSYIKFINIRFRASHRNYLYNIEVCTRRCLHCVSRQNLINKKKTRSSAEAEQPIASSDIMQSTHEMFVITEVSVNRQNTIFSKGYNFDWA